MQGLKKVLCDHTGQADFLLSKYCNFYSLLAWWEKVQASHPLTKLTKKNTRSDPGKQHVSENCLPKGQAGIQVILMMVMIMTIK